MTVVGTSRRSPGTSDLAFVLSGPIPIAAVVIAVVATLGTTHAASSRVKPKDVETALKLHIAGDTAKSLAQRLQSEKRSPLVDGRKVVFVLESEAAQPPKLIGDVSGGRDWRMERLPGTRIWVFLHEFPEDQKFTYRYEVDGKASADPWNSEQDSRGASLVIMPKYRAPRESAPSSQPGEVKPLSFHSRILDSERKGWIYVPRQYSGEPAPVMIFQDGSGYRNAHLPEILDSLIEKKKIPVLVAVMLDPVRRSEEYDTVSDRYGRFLRDEVLPLIRKDYPLLDDPMSRGVAGISSGGICAFSAAWFLPETFGRVLSQSGSFVSIEKGNTYPDLVRAAPKKNIRGYMSVSSNDLDNRFGNWEDANHLLWGALRQQGYEFFYHEDEGFHNWFTWELQLPEALVRTWAGWTKP